MSWIQHHMTLATDVTRIEDKMDLDDAPAKTETIKTTLPSPGQRGIVQTLVQGKRDLQAVRPHLTQVNKLNQAKMGHYERHRHTHQRLADQTERVLRYCNTLRQRHVRQRADAALEAESRGEAVPEKDKEQEADEPVISLRQLAKIIKGLQAVDKGANVARDMVLNDEKALALEESVKQTQTLAEELRRQIDRQVHLSAMWMHTKWTRDANTAVGRGPPGHIAFNPFTLHDPPFEKHEATQVVLEGLHHHPPGAATATGGVLPSGNRNKVV
jgi:hypothetical protein